ncbi:helix-turn-helix domain-containing protein [Caloramator sp. CAR-1]|uniref:helix-turn-helix domain-containing protein n=1 Tax=Caloramator sp. CAR-1 TaxID=3062777 RepID=UPI0026E3C4AC|nr:helix-turn-helix domain-containing protein [Caloramator sp. CAR-1]MDO6353566.1 helix-turn-helix domain-containing protein [Caloramator sp. CAR-1]
MQTFGERLRQLRKEKQMTGSELGKLLNVSKVAISNWENGNRFPDKDMLLKIAEIFNVSVDYLLGKTDIRNQNKTTVDIQPTPDYPHKVTARDKKQYLEYIKTINEAFFMNDEIDEADKKAILETMNEIFWMAKAMRKKKKD